MSKGENVFLGGGFLTGFTASLLEPETSPKGCHSGESYFSQESTA